MEFAAQIEQMQDNLYLNQHGIGKTLIYMLYTYIQTINPVNKQYSTAL